VKNGHVGSAVMVACAPIETRSPGIRATAREKVPPVIPAKAAIQSLRKMQTLNKSTAFYEEYRVPAFAGTTGESW
jgi:hypothetical protein